MRRSLPAVEQAARRIFNRTPMKDGAWSPDEIALLKSYYGACTPEALQLVMRRPTASIERVVERLRLIAERRTEPLSDDAVMKLKRLYGGRATRDLVVIFDRPEATIDAAAQAACLSKDKAFIRREGGSSRMPRWTTAEVKRLQDLYLNNSNEDIARELGRSVKSVVSKAHNLGLKKSADRLRAMGRENVTRRYK